MSNTMVECGNCGNPSQQATLNKHGHCPHCASCRVSSPPPEPETPAPDVTRFRGAGHYAPSGAALNEKLCREPLKSKIPIADLIASGALQLPPFPRVPADADGS